jgi:hypothetical protein
MLCRTSVRHQFINESLTLQMLPCLRLRSAPIGSKNLCKMTTDCVQEHHTKKTGFDAAGMLFSILPFPICWSPRNATFCSKYVTEALQCAHLECVQHYYGSIVTPSKLYNILRDGTVDREVAGSVHHKQQQLNQTSLPLISMPQGASITYTRL